MSIREHMTATVVLAVTIGILTAFVLVFTDIATIGWF